MLSRQRPRVRVPVISAILYLDCPSKLDANGVDAKVTATRSRVDSRQISAGSDLYTLAPSWLQPLPENHELVQKGSRGSARKMSARQFKAGDTSGTQERISSCS
jgi:hypothetical protein